MRRTHGHHLVSGLLLVGVLLPLYGQTPASDLDSIGAQLVSFFQEKRPAWEHSTVAPLAAPGSQPSRDVAIHFWRSKRCLTTDELIDGVKREGLPVYCNVKVAAYQFPSAEAAHAHLSEFVAHQQERKTQWKLTPLALGDEGYLWSGRYVVFRKGRFSYWLSSVVGNTYGHDPFAMEKEATESFAKDVAQAVAAN